MKYQQETYNIHNINYFRNYVKKEATNTFLVSFSKSKEFIELYEESLLTDDLVKIECNKHIFINPDNSEDLLIFNEDIEKIIKALYKELVEKILNKLVDDGILEMCWDAEKMEIIWRKKKGIHVSRRIQRYRNKP
jgi:hypothetical protein